MAGSIGSFGNQGQFVTYADMLAASNAGQFVNFSLSSSGASETIPASQIVGGLYQRSGATAAVTATTDTAANIIAALGPTVKVGQTFVLFYTNNNTAAGAVTMAGGTGVTVSGTSVVPVYNTGVFVGTVASATTIALQGVYTSGGVDLPGFQFTTISSGNGTLSAGAIEGANFTALATSGATALTTRTAAQMITQAGLIVGQSYVLRVYNTNAGTLTLTGGTGVTITGTATIATNVFRDYGVTVTGSAAITLQNIGAGNAT